MQCVSPCSSALWLLSAVKQCLGLFVLSTQAGKLLDSSWCFAQTVIFADAWLLLWLPACMHACRQAVERPGGFAFADPDILTG